MEIDRKTQLEQEIQKQGLASPSINREYNQLTGNNSGAADYYNSIKNQTVVNTPNNDIPLKNKATTVEKTNQATNIAGTTETPLKTQNNSVSESVIDNKTKEQEYTTASGNKVSESQYTNVLDKGLSEGKITQEQYNKSKKQLDEYFGISPKQAVSFNSVSEFKNAGGGTELLSKWIESDYGTQTEIVNGKVRADIDGITYEWGIDSAGNPIRKKLGTTETVQQETQYNKLGGDDFFNMMMKGETINTGLVKDNPEYIKAEKRFNAFNTFDKTPEGIYRGLKNGTLNTDLSLYNDLVKNGYGDVINKQTEKVIGENSKLEANGMKGEITDKSMAELTYKETIELIKETTGQLYGDYYNSMKEDYENNPVINGNKDKYNSDYNKLVKLQQDKENLYNDLVTKYPNSSRAFINSMYNKQNQALEQEIRTYTANVATYENAVKTELSVLKDKYAVRQDIENKKLNTFNELISYKNNENQRQATYDVNVLQQTSLAEREQAEREFEMEKFEKEQAFNTYKLQLEQEGKGISISSLTTEQQSLYNKSLKYINSSLPSDIQKQQSSIIAKLVSEGKTEEQIANFMGAVNKDTLGGSYSSLGIIYNSLGLDDTEKSFIDGLVNEYGINSPQVLDQLKVKANNKLSVGQETQINALMSTKNALEDIQSKYLALEEAGGLGIFEKGGQEWDKWIRNNAGLSPELAEFETMATEALQVYRKSMTGAAFSEKEMAEYRKLFPNAITLPAIGKAQLKTLIKSQDNKINEIYGSVMNRTAFDDLFIKGNKTISNITGGNELATNASTGKTYKDKDGNDISVNDLLYTENGTVIPTNLPSVSSYNKVGGMECGEYINAAFGTNLGNTYEDKMSKMDYQRQFKFETVKADIGDIVVWKPSNEGAYAYYGHTGFIVDENSTQYKIKSSNYTKGGTITEDWVPKGLIDGKLTTERGQEYKASLSGDTGGYEFPNNTGLGDNMGGGEDKKGIIGGAVDLGTDAVKGIWDVAMGGGKKVVSGMDYLSSKTIVPALNATLGKVITGVSDLFGADIKPLTPEQYREFTGASRNGAEAIFDATSGTLDIGAVSNVSSAAAIGIISMIGGTEIGGDVLGGIANLIESGGNWVNKLPVGLKQFREALPEDRREEFDTYVGGLALAAVGKGAKAGLKTKIGQNLKTKILGKTANQQQLMEAALNPSSKNTKIFEGLDTNQSASIIEKGAKGLNQVVDDLPKKPTYNDIASSIQKKLDDLTSQKNNQLSNIKGKIKSQAGLDVAKAYGEYLSNSVDSNKKLLGKQILKDSSKTGKYSKEGFTAKELSDLQSEFNKISKEFSTTGKMNYGDATTLRESINNELIKSGLDKTLNNQISELVTAKDLVKEQIGGLKQSGIIQTQQSVTGNTAKKLLATIAASSYRTMTGIAGNVVNKFSGKITPDILEKNLLPKIVKEAKKAKVPKTQVKAFLKEIGGTTLNSSVLTNLEALYDNE